MQPVASRLLTRCAIALSVVWCCACDSGEPFDICATVPIKRGEVMGTGRVQLRTDGVEASAEQVRIAPGREGLVVKFCKVHKGRLSAAYLAWRRDPAVQLPAPLRVFNTSQHSDTPRDGIEGSWKSCVADDCDIENGRVHFESWMMGGSRNGAGEYTALDLERGHIAAWAKFDVFFTTWCDLDDRESSRGPCSEDCNGLPCRHDFGEHIEIDVDVTWTPPADAGVKFDDGGM